MSSQDKGFADGLVGQAVDHPWRTLLVGLALIGALIPGGQYITANFTYRVWFSEEDPLLKEFDAFERRFGNDEASMVIVHSPSGVFDEDTATLLRDLTEKLWKVKDVILVTSLSNFNWVRNVTDAECLTECTGAKDACLEECSELRISELIPDPKEEPWTGGLLDARKAAALAHETLPNYLVSADGKTALLYATLRPAIDEPTDYEAVHGEIAKLLDDSRRGDHVLLQSGAPAMNTSFKTAAQTDMMNLVPAALGLAILLLIVIFKRVSGVILPLLVIILSVVGTMTLSGWLDFPITNTTSIIPQILLAIAVADSVHILHSYFHALGEGLQRREAARFSLRKNLLPTLLTSVTTAIGFASFSTAPVVPIGQLGLLSAFGTLLAWFITYAVFGPLMVLLPLKGKPSRAGVDLEGISPRARRIVGRVLGNARALVAGFVILTGVSLFFALRIDVNSDPFSYFPADSELNKAANLLEEHVGGALPVELVLDSGREGGFKDPAWLAKADALQTWLVQQPHVTSAVSIIDILKAMNRSMHHDAKEEYRLPNSEAKIAQLKLLYEQGLPQGMNINDRVPIQNDAIRVTFMVDVHDSRTVIDLMDGVVAEAKTRGLDAHITGKAQLWQRMNPYVVDTFVTSLLIALLAMCVIMMVTFRSWKIGLLSMVPNSIPLVIGAALLKLIDKPLDIGTVLVFSISLGIAVDDTIHFLANYNRLRLAGRSTREAIEVIFTHTMPPLLITTLILCAAFGVFLFATFVPNIYFGLLIAFVLAVAMVCDAFLLPALLGLRVEKAETPAAAREAAE